MAEFIVTNTPTLLLIIVFKIHNTFVLIYYLLTYTLYAFDNLKRFKFKIVIFYRENSNIIFSYQFFKKFLVLTL